MCAHGVEIAQDDALEGCAGVDYVGYDFLGNLFCVAVGGSCLLDRGLLGYGVHIRLAVDCARG